MASAASTAVQNVTLNYTAVSQCSHSPLSIFALVVGLLGLLSVIFSALHCIALFLLFVCWFVISVLDSSVCLSVFVCVCVSFFFFFLSQTLGLLSSSPKIQVLPLWMVKQMDNKCLIRWHIRQYSPAIGFGLLKFKVWSVQSSEYCSLAHIMETVILNCCDLTILKWHTLLKHINCIHCLQA